MSGLSLYKIDAELREVTDLIIENGGLVDEATLARLNIGVDQLEGKAISYAHVIKQAEYEADIISAEIARLTAMKKAREKTAEHLSNAIGGAMNAFDIKEVKSPTIRIFFRPSKAVEIVNEAAIPEEYWKVSEPVRSLDKVKITTELKAGRSVFGAELQERKNLQIK